MPIDHILENAAMEKSNDESVLQKLDARSHDGLPRLSRANLLTTLDALFSNYDLVLLEGEDGIGRTTLAQDFAANKAGKAISAFIRPDTRWGFDPAVLQEVFAEEIIHILGREMPSSNHVITNAEYFQLISDLQRRCRRSKEVVYFVIDGIDALANADSSLRESLLDANPSEHHRSSFCFLGTIRLIFPCHIATPQSASQYLR